MEGGRIDRVLHNPFWFDDHQRLVWLYNNMMRANVEGNTINECNRRGRLRLSLTCASFACYTR